MHERCNDRFYAIYVGQTGLISIVFLGKFLVFYTEIIIILIVISRV